MDSRGAVSSLCLLVLIRALPVAPMRLIAAKGPVRYRRLNLPSLS